MVWRADDPIGAESLKIRHLVVPYTRGRILELGAGPWRCWPHFTTLDNFQEFPGVIDPNTGRPWVPDVRGGAEDLSLFADNSFDGVYSSHLLEHLDDTEAVLTEWWRVIKVGGFLVLYLPDKEFYPNIGEPGANTDHVHDFTPEDIENIMIKLGSWDLVVNQRRNQGLEYSFLQVYLRLENPA